MNKYFKYIIVLILVVILTGCSTDNKELNDKEDVVDMSEVTLKINNNDYSINFENNKTVEDLLNHLPLTLTMSELNGNEYYSYTSFDLIADAKKQGHINAGDVMLYGDNCIVIFYKSFDTSYSYTRIGHIDNIDNLEEDLKSCNVSFIKKEV